MLNKKVYSEYLSTVSLKGRAYKFFLLYPRLTKLLPLPSLDVGCGLGAMLKYHPGMIGVDINEYSVEACLSAGLKAVRMDYDTLPFANDDFKSLLLDNVMEHISSPSKLLLEVHRVLVPQGNAIFGIPGDKGYMQDYDHKINYSNDAFIELVERFGFKLSHIFYSPFESTYLNHNAKFYCRYFNFIKL